MNKNKLLIIDVDLRTIYDSGYDIQKLTEFIKELQNRFEILVSSTSWHKNIINFINLVNLDVNDVNLVASDGACLWKKSDKKFYYEGFFKKNDYDLINHFALIKQSGIVIEGASSVDSYDNLMTTYFLNYNAIKKASLRWKYRMDWNNDYATFNEALNKMLVSQIYLYNIKEWINSEDFNQTILDNERFDFIKLNDDDGLFINKNINKYKTIKKHFEDRFLIYLSLNNKIDLSLYERFDYCVIPTNMNEEYKNNAHFIYEPNDLDSLLKNLQSII
ncbi:hypothetical protein [Mycoplasma bradburyae]|uniref:Uncharacterized protein n=1 Tax=Mycoplasma bradburyae TaxID=2963128 RepID=A0AAW6HST3_9MOLU|nr:hypothetical protein [Mycoplasma bradburyae]MDC4163549.1 hypothetical protein [Mycoplasma bradburyae]MDC4182147.1 hypothetical protein [Mycoplasma bradburyae]MDC4182912.1 hypothetical protein [Mycoplasma bradburyae]MDC4183595.1 hypothetical protein [Mycoplasma bradburyae]MDC4184333.1 hypothetical protein [Mycoplasma bradburyae]